MTDLLELCSGLRLASTQADQVLFDEGDPPGHLFVLVSGAVAIERDGVPLARVDTPGAVFGEMSVVLDHPATATVRATSDVTARVIEDPMTFLAAHPGAALAVLKMTAGRLDGMTRYLADVKTQLTGADGHLGMVGQILDTLLHHQGSPAIPGSARDPEAPLH